jgi:hypothetical protein
MIDIPLRRCFFSLLSRAVNDGTGTCGVFRRRFVFLTFMATTPGMGYRRGRQKLSAIRY